MKKFPSLRMDFYDLLTAGFILYLLIAAASSFYIPFDFAYNPKDFDRVLYDYFSAQEAKDVDKALTFTLPVENGGKITKQGLSGFMQAVPIRFSNVETTQIELLPIGFGRSLRVTATLTYESGNKGKIYIYFRRSLGSWKIVDLNFAPQWPLKPTTSPP